MGMKSWTQPFLRVFRLNLEKCINQIQWTTFFFVVFMSQQILSWPLVNSSGWGGGSPYIDARSVLHASECSNNIGWDVYNPLRWEDCGYIYGSQLIRILRALNINPEHTNQVGWLFILFFSIISGYVLTSIRKLSKTQQAASVLILVSPGTMLLLERGNFDSLIIIMLFVSAICIARGYLVLGIILVALTALFKFYTLPLLFMLSFKFRTSRGKILSLILSCFVGYLIVQDLTLIKGDFPSNVMASFGNQIPGLYLNYAGVENTRFHSEILGFTLLILACALIVFFSKGPIAAIVNLMSMKEKDDSNMQIQLLFFSTFSICYFAGVNYDYRISLLTVPLLLSLNELRALGRNIWYLLIPSLVIAWTSYNVGALQVVGDAVIIVLTAALLIVAFRLGKIKAREFIARGK